jgi:hypothetical protein
LVYVILHQVPIIETIFLVALLPLYVIPLRDSPWALLGDSVFHLLQLLKVVDLLLILFDPFHVLNHLILEVVLISIVIVVGLVFVDSRRLGLGFLLGLAPALSVGRLDLHLDLLELLQVLHLVLVETHHVLEA